MHSPHLLPIFLSFLSPLAAQQPNAFIVAGPNVKSVIVIATDWQKGRWCDWGGHAILQRYAKLITGANLRHLKTKPGARDRYDFRIWIGRQPEVDRVIGEALATIDDDGYIIHCTGRDLYVSGKFWWGTNWAVHDLLERFAGCRWYLMEPRFWEPRKDGMIGPGDIVPKAESIRVPADTHIIEEPDYKSRWFRIVPIHSFRVRQRYQFHHALRRIVPASKLFTSHPDFFPEIDGKRYQPRHDNDCQPCATNPAVVEHVSRHIIDYFTQHPEASSISIGMNDSNRFCECKGCLGMAPTGITEKRARIAYAFWRFYNEIAERVTKVHPRKRLGCLAYAGLRAVPAGSIKIHPMIVPYVTVDSAQLHDPAQQEEFAATIGKWQGMTSRMGIYEYMYGGGFVIPRIYNRYLIPNIKARYGAGVDGFYSEAYPNWGLDGPKYWLVSKLLWDTDADPEKLLDQFYTDLFGPAAAAMREYFDYLEEVWCTQTLASDRSNYRWLRDPKQLEIFAPDKCDRAWALIEAAEKLAPDDAVRQRIAFSKTSFAVTRVLCTRYARAQEANTLSEKTPLDVAAVLTKLQDWLGAGDLEETVRRARALGFSAFSTTGRNELDHIANYDRQPNKAVERLVADAMDRAITGQRFAAATQARQSIGAIVDAEAARVAGKDVRTALTFVRGVATERGFMFVRTLGEPPTLDGTIGQDEWGTPFFAGHFYPVVHVRGQSSSVLDRGTPETTRVWAGRCGNALYFAFDMEQAPEMIGATITDRDTTHWRNADMRNDDAIVLSSFRQGTVYQQVRVNANGAISDFAGSNLKWDAAEAAVGRSETGWQVELRVSMKRLNIAPRAKAKGPPELSLARYTRRLDPKKKGTARAEPSTLVPFAPGRGVIGHGNHPHMMMFRTSARVCYQDTLTE